MRDILIQFFADFRNILGEMSPYLLLGFLIAGLLSVILPTRLVQRHLGRSGVGSLVKAAAFGVPLPLCSCGVIPVSMGLFKRGASRASTISFLLSTPQTGVDSILVTYSLLGGVFAVYRPLAALVTGIVGGLLIQIFLKKDAAQSSEQEDSEQQDSGDDRNWFVRAMEHGFVTLPKSFAGSMLIGLAIAGVISAAVPADYFSGLLGGGIISMLIMMALGIPIYVCATASVPIAVALIAKGASPGAALVFLMTGPATNAAAFTTLWSVLGAKSAIIYLLTTCVCALSFGFLLDMLFMNTDFSAELSSHQMIPGVIKNVSAALLMVLLLYNAGLKFYSKHKAAADQ